MAFNERKVVFFKSYFQDFYLEQDEEARKKIAYTLNLIQKSERVSEKFLKHLTGTTGIYEVRISCSSKIYRVLCCFDEGSLVVLFNGFIKKTQKTPLKEIVTAEKLKKEYFNEKGKRKK